MKDLEWKLYNMRNNLEAEINHASTMEKIQDVFERYFPTGVIEPIKRDDLLRFYTRSGIEGRDAYLFSTMGRFQNYFKISHSDRSVTYVGSHGNGDDPTSIVEAHFWDLTDNGSLQGWGVMRKWGQRDIPHVASTETLWRHRRKGLGMRRLTMLNAMSRALYNFPLHSDNPDMMSNTAIKVWEKLVRMGKAQRFNEYGLTRYKFI